MTIAENALVKTARPRHVPFIETVDALASDLRVQETFKLVPPILVRTMPAPLQSPPNDCRNPASDVSARAGRQVSESKAAIRTARMTAPPELRAVITE